MKYAPAQARRSQTPLFYITVVWEDLFKLTSKQTIRDGEMDIKTLLLKTDFEMHK